METWRVSLVLCCMLVFVCTPPRAANQLKTITVTGNLSRVAGIGGETTGWAIRLGSEIEINDKHVSSIEVSGDKQWFAKFENKHVEAEGELSTRHGVERGEWVVLEVNSIRELAKNQ